MEHGNGRRVMIKELKLVVEELPSSAIHPVGTGQLAPPCSSISLVRDM